MTPQDIQEPLNCLNKISKRLERLQDSMDHRCPNTAYSDDQEAVLAMGKEDLKHCSYKFKLIKGEIEHNISRRLGLKADILRVIFMKSELDTEVYECSICLVAISRVDKTWSCSSCYNVLHMKCVKAHAVHELSSEEEGTADGVSWKCPVCRHPKRSHPLRLEYTCFCGAVLSPRPIEGATAHGCGGRCQRTRQCTMQCHPAPCPVTRN